MIPNDAAHSNETNSPQGDKVPWSVLKSPVWNNLRFNLDKNKNKSFNKSFKKAVKLWVKQNVRPFYDAFYDLIGT